ncbi:MAG: hypothetical protein COA46_10630 [Porticoccaceae bacterium]|nr:MAG: hypothetical protein COA46_10630 [Porticoccaceae bacterium]
MKNCAIVIFIILFLATGCQRSDEAIEVESSRISELVKEQFSRESTMHQAEKFMSAQGLDFSYLSHEECLSGIGSSQLCTGGKVLHGIKTLNQGSLGVKSHVLLRLYFHKSGDYAWFQVNTAHTFL